MKLLGASRSEMSYLFFYSALDLEISLLLRSRASCYLLAAWLIIGAPNFREHHGILSPTLLEGASLRLLEVFVWTAEIAIQQLTS